MVKRGATYRKLLTAAAVTIMAAGFAAPVLHPYTSAAERTAISAADTLDNGRDGGDRAVKERKQRKRSRRQDAVDTGLQADLQRALEANRAADTVPADTLNPYDTGHRFDSLPEELRPRLTVPDSLRATYRYTEGLKRASIYGDSAAARTLRDGVTISRKGWHPRRRICPPRIPYGYHKPLVHQHIRSGVDRHGRLRPRPARIPPSDTYGCRQSRQLPHHGHTLPAAPTALFGHRGTRLGRHASGQDTLSECAQTPPSGLDTPVRPRHRGGAAGIRRRPLRAEQRPLARAGIRRRRPRLHSPRHAARGRQYGLHECRRAGRIRRLLFRARRHAPIPLYAEAPLRQRQLPAREEDLALQPPDRQPQVLR